VGRESGVEGAIVEDSVLPTHSPFPVVRYLFFFTFVLSPVGVSVDAYEMGCFLPFSPEPVSS